MRLLLVTGEFPPMQGGVGDYTNEIAKGFAACGEQVCVLTSTQAKDQHPFPVLPLVDAWNWSSLRLVANRVREFAPDIVHIQYQTGAYGMHPAIDFLPQFLRSTPALSKRAERSFRSVVTFHDLRIPYLFPKAGPVREWVTRHLACTSDAVIATNEPDYAQLANWSVRLAALIPIGSNLSTVPPPDYDRRSSRARWGVGDDETLLCHFGFVNVRKGCDTLLRALANIPKAKLLMIGGQTGASDPTNVVYLKQIQALIAELGLSERVFWTGFTTPEIVTANFLASDLCVLPYREGASYQHGTLMAALAHGTPVVTTVTADEGLLRETKDDGQRTKSELPRLVDGENCLLVRPDDPAALAQAIQRAVESPELRAHIGEGARSLAQHFTWDKIVQQHLALYRRMA
jgi:glycosyltransferase involved in cell wall biosynthesis